MEGIVLHVTYHCYPGQAQAFVRALKESGLQNAVKGEDGCLQYDYHLSCEEENAVVLLERWRDAQALSVHGETDTMARIKAVKERFVERTDVLKFE